MTVNACAAEQRVHALRRCASRQLRTTVRQDLLTHHLLPQRVAAIPHQLLESGEATHCCSLQHTAVTSTTNALLVRSKI
jgi:hypothetical protein